MASDRPFVSKRGSSPRPPPASVGEVKPALPTTRTLPATSISDIDFLRITTLIQEQTGIYIPPGKKALLCARLSDRMCSLGLTSYSDYLHHVRTSESGELWKMMDAVCTNETRFFRDAEQLSHIETKVVPAWLVEAGRAGVPRRIRVWSAGCSTGEEAFTIAMLLLSKSPPGREHPLFAVEILATDISNAALDKARAARFAPNRMLEIPEAYRQRYFEQDPASLDFQPSAELRNLVRFQRLNLSDANYPMTGRFDLILCRNVLIYFDAETRASVVRRLVSRLAPKGLLLLGMTESILAAQTRPNYASGYRPSEQRQAGRYSVGDTHLKVVGPAIYKAVKEGAPESRRGQGMKGFGA